MVPSESLTRGGSASSLTHMVIHCWPRGFSIGQLIIWQLASLTMNKREHKRESMLEIEAMVFCKLTCEVTFCHFSIFCLLEGSL